MSLSANTMKWSITCSGDKDVDIVTLDQQLYSEDDIEVILKTIADGTETTLTKTTDYTVGNVPSAAATVTTVSDYSSAYELHVRRVAKGTQTVDFVTGDSFPDPVVEKVMDKLVMDTQVNNDQMRRAVKWSKTSALRDLELADPADNGGKAIGVNAGGTGLVYYTTSTLADADLNDLLNAGFSTIIYPQSIEIGNAGLKIISGSGTPEASVTGDVGSIYMRTNGATLTALYVKVSGTGNTGWRQIVNADDTSGNVDLGAGTLTATSLISDTISEEGAANGVTVDSCLIKDGAAALSNTVTDQGGGNALQCKVIEIGDWNMDSTTDVNVAHGLSGGTYQKIRSISVIIRDDNDVGYYPLMSVASEANVVGGGATSFGATNIVLTRDTGGVFDAVGFDSTSFNRGWITIWYTE
jgi:hypothetical protein